MPIPPRPPVSARIPPKISPQPSVVQYSQPVRGKPITLMVTLGLFSLFVIFVSTAFDCRESYGWLTAYIRPAPQVHSRRVTPSVGDPNSMLGLAACTAFLALTNFLLLYAAVLSIRGHREGIRRHLTFVKIRIVLLALEGILVAYWSWSIENDADHPTLGATTAPVAFAHFLAIGLSAAYVLALYVIITRTPSLRRMLD